MDRNLTEKASYIKGLADGLALDNTTKEGKVLLALLDLVNDMAGAVSDNADDIEQIYDELDAVDEDLTDVEDYVFGDDEDDEGEECDEDNPVYEITCPKCGEVMYADEEMLENEDLSCPSCGADFEIEFEDDDKGEEEPEKDEKK